MNIYKHRKDTKGNTMSMHVSSASFKGDHDFEAHSVSLPLPWFSAPLREHGLYSSVYHSLDFLFYSFLLLCYTCFYLYILHYLAF